MAHTYSITIRGVHETTEALERWQKRLNERVRMFEEALAEYGVGIARIRFGRAQYDGDNDVTLDPVKWEGNTLAVRAVGSAVLFIEFGTGVHYEAESHPQAGEFGFERGGYGYHLGRFDSWRYKGNPGTNGEVIQSGKHAGEVLTHGNPANRCMYETAELMRQNIERIAREVFR